MPHAYCNQCLARVTVRDGLCLLDHPVDLATVSSSSGRRAKPGRRRSKTTTMAPAAVPAPAPADEAVRQVVDLTAIEEPRPLVSVALPAAPTWDPPSVVPVPELPPPDDTPVDDDPWVAGDDGSSSTSVAGIDEEPGVSSTLHDLAPTGDLIASLWHHDLAPAPQPEWRVGAVDEILLDDRRSPRWRRVVVMAVLALGFGWVLGGFLGDDTQTLRRVALADATAVGDALDAVTPVVADLGDGVADDTVANGTLLGDLDHAARTLFATSARLDPDDPDSARLRRTTSELATAALEVEATLVDVTAYGAAVTRLAVAPRLAGQATADTLPQATAEVTAWVAGFSNGTSMLPHNPHTDEHRAEMESLAVRLETWQQAYLDALRTGDDAAATIRELEGWLDTAAESWITTADQTVSWADQRREELRATVTSLSPPS